MENHEEDLFTCQYRECYESWRQHVRFIWQIPTITVAIAGGLGVTTFAYVQEWFGRGCLFMFGAILTGCLLYAVIKHRYFSFIEQETLCEIERVSEIKKLIQRTTRPQKETYWYTKKPNWCQKCSAEHVLMGGMVLILAILLALSAWAFYMAVIS